MTDREKDRDLNRKKIDIIKSEPKNDMMIDAIHITTNIKFTSNQDNNSKNDNSKYNNTKLFSKTLPYNKDNISIKIKSTSDDPSQPKIDKLNPSYPLHEDTPLIALSHSKSYSTQADSEYQTSRSDKDSINLMHKTMPQSNSDVNINVRGRTHLSIPGLKRELKHSTHTLSERDRIIRKSCSSG